MVEWQTRQSERLILRGASSTLAGRTQALVAQWKSGSLLNCIMRVRIPPRVPISKWGG